MKVVGTMFFKDRKLLIDKPRKRNTFQMIGGRVEENETPLEELGENAKFDKTKFELVMEFDEIATSDGITKIHFYVYKYNGTLEGNLTTSDEIERFLWYTTKEKEILSNTLNNEVIPYCITNNLID